MFLALIIITLLSFTNGALVFYLVYCGLINPRALVKDEKRINYTKCNEAYSRKGN